MKMVLVIVSAALAASSVSAQQAPRDRQISVADDRGRRTAVIIMYGGTPDRPLIRVDGQTITLPPENGRVAYELWVSNFDCAARTRALDFKILYSSEHDPRRTLINPDLVSDASDPVVADQLALVCDGVMEGRETYSDTNPFIVLD
jgi:hypothetical protein